MTLLSNEEPALSHEKSLLFFKVIANFTKKYLQLLTEKRFTFPDQHSVRKKDREGGWLFVTKDRSIGEHVMLPEKGY